MVLDNLLQNTKKAVATTAMLGMLNLAGCVKGDYALAPQINPQTGSIGMYVTNNATAAVDANYDNTDSSKWTDGEKAAALILGGLVVGGVIYAASKSAGSAPAAQTPVVVPTPVVPTCPPGTAYNPVNGLCQ